MSKNIKVKKRSNKIGINRLSSISNLEADIMNIVWSKEKITVREVHEIILLKEIKKKQHGFIPYTTVMSTMATLTDKGLLKQDKSAKTYIFFGDGNGSMVKILRHCQPKGTGAD